jgi:hypothetical protein
MKLFSKGLSYNFNFIFIKLFSYNTVLFDIIEDSLKSIELEFRSDL